ncbi:MAG: hypothetical protein N6V49_00300 [Serratia symbiotica]|nr:hypothetical protein [Serratia symbiotica]
MHILNAASGLKLQAFQTTNGLPVAQQATAYPTSRQATALGSTATNQLTVTDS